MTEKKKVNAMAFFAMLFGVAGLVACLAPKFGVAGLPAFTGALAPLCVGITITFAWLSRGNKKMNGLAKFGNLLAIITILVGAYFAWKEYQVIAAQLQELFAENADVLEELYSEFYYMVEPYLEGGAV